MSVDDKIRTHLANGQLIQVTPEFDGDRIVRQLFVHQEAWSFIKPEEPHHAIISEERAQRAIEDLLRFVDGSRIICAREPFDKPANTYLMPIHSEGRGVWAIRNRDVPHIRFFGLFPKVDTFVVTYACLRADLDSKEMWEQIRTEAVAIYSELFPNSLPEYERNASHVCTNIILV